MAELAYIGLGSNLGDRLAHLRRAVVELTAYPGVCLEAASSVYETAPQGYLDQPFFLNAVLSVRTCLAPFALLKVMGQIEARHGRQRPIHWGPRTLDLDLLLYGQEQIDTPELVLPHPRLTERAFVLAPLCELAPDLRHPLTGKLLSLYLGELEKVQPVQRLGSLLPADLPRFSNE